MAGPEDEAVRVRIWSVHNDAPLRAMRGRSCQSVHVYQVASRSQSTAHGLGVASAPEASARYCTNASSLVRTTAAGCVT